MWDVDTSLCLGSILIFLSGDVIQAVSCYVMDYLQFHNENVQKTYSPLCVLVPIMLTENYFHFIPINYRWNGKWEITSQNEKQSICQPSIVSIKVSVPSTATTDHKFFYKSHTKNSSVHYKCVLAIWITNILSADFDGNNLSIWSNEG